MSVASRLGSVVLATLIVTSSGSINAETPATISAEPMADSWPQWRGVSRDGQFTGPTWPERLQGERLTKLWRVADLGPSYSGPIVTEDRVFTTETKDERMEVVRAFDRRTGAPLWSAEWPGAMKVPFFAGRNGSWVRSTPAWDGERLYVAGMRDVLVCLDGDTGSTVWRVDFTERFGTPNPSFGFVCSPLVTDDAIYTQAGGGVVRLDKRTGASVWRTMEDGGGMNSAFSSPVLATMHGREQLLVQSRTTLYGLDPASGAKLWSQPIKAFRGMNILTPAAHGDAVFTAPYGGRTQLLTVSSSDGAFEVDQAWNQRLQGYMTSPVLIGGYAYFFTRSNRFACVRLEDGAEAWVSGPTGDSYWSLVAQGDRIVALSDTGRLRLIKATPEAYEVIDEAPVADDETWAHLAMAGREIFIREQHGLVAYRWQQPE